MLRTTTTMWQRFASATADVVLLHRLATQWLGLEHEGDEPLQVLLPTGVIVGIDVASAVVLLDQQAIVAGHSAFSFYLSDATDFVVGRSSGRGLTLDRVDPGLVMDATSLEDLQAEVRRQAAERINTGSDRQMKFLRRELSIGMPTQLEAAVLRQADLRNHIVHRGGTLDSRSGLRVQTASVADITWDACIANWVHASNTVDRALIRRFPYAAAIPDSDEEDWIEAQIAQAMGVDPGEEE